MGLRQVDVSRKVLCCHNAVTYWENGQRKPRDKYIRRLCKLFEVTESDLYSSHIGQKTANFSEKEVKKYLKETQESVDTINGYIYSLKGKGGLTLEDTLQLKLKGGNHVYNTEKGRYLVVLRETPGQKNPKNIKNNRQKCRKTKTERVGL